jgi:hypothetical protein
LDLRQAMEQNTLVSWLFLAFKLIKLSSAYGSAPSS